MFTHPTRLPTHKQERLDDLAAKYRSMSNATEKLMDEKVHGLKVDIVSKLEPQIAQLAIKIRKAKAEASQAMGIAKSNGRAGREEDKNQRDLSTLVWKSKSTLIPTTALTSLPPCNTLHNRRSKQQRVQRACMS